VGRGVCLVTGGRERPFVILNEFSNLSATVGVRFAAHLGAGA